MTSIEEIELGQRYVYRGQPVTAVRIVTVEDKGWRKYGGHGHIVRRVVVRSTEGEFRVRARDLYISKFDDPREPRLEIVEER